MIFLTTEDLLTRFGLFSDVYLINGRKKISLADALPITRALKERIENALNARLSGDSVNYELAISKIIESGIEKGVNNNIRSLAFYLILESSLTNWTFEDKKSIKKTEEIKRALEIEVCEQVAPSDLVIAILSLSYIFGNEVDRALMLCHKIKSEHNLRQGIKAFINYQKGKIAEALDELEGLDRTDDGDVFLHLCSNLKVFIAVQDGRLSLFQNLFQELETLNATERSHLAPIIQSNRLYLLNYREGPTLSFDNRTARHYENVLLYHECRELDLLDNLKNSAMKLTIDEMYEGIETYGKDTLRLSNTPDAVGERLSRYIFLHSFMGSCSGFTQGKEYFVKTFFTLGDLFKDQSMYKESLRNAVSIGSSTHIEKIVKAPSFIKDADTVSYFENLVSGNPYLGATSIGISYLIKYMYQFFSKKSEPFVVSHLKREMQRELSFTSSFDHARPALEAVYFACHTLPENLGLELYRVFSNLTPKLPISMIALDSINKVVLNMPESLIARDLYSSRTLCDFYFENINSFFKSDQEMTLLSLAKLVKHSPIEEKNKFLKVIDQELHKTPKDYGKRIMLFDILRDLNGDLALEMASEVIGTVSQSFFSSDSKGYSATGVGSGEALFISTKFFDSLEPSAKDKYLSRMVSSLLDPHFSISNKIQVLSALDRLSEKIDRSYFTPIYDFILKHREGLFSWQQTDKMSAFRSTSFVTYRALLYACASLAPVQDTSIFSLDLLRLSVSTEAHVREIFIESSTRLVLSHESHSENSALLHRCYELTFDPDPKVRGVAAGAIIELLSQINATIRDSYLVRLKDISNDKSEIARSYLAHSLTKYGKNLPPDLYDSLENQLEGDINFYVRRNIRNKHIIE